MPAAGNPSQSPEKKSGKKLHRDIILEESESPEKQQSGQKPNGQQASLEGSHGLTSFQNYIITKNSSPIQKLRDREGATSESPDKSLVIQPNPVPSTYHHHYHHG
jgi:hypothetical protein